MPDLEDRNRRHLLLNSASIKERYTSPKGGPSSEFVLFTRDRESHARFLKEQLETARTEAEQQGTIRTQLNARGEFGIYLVFESEPQFQLRVESLDRSRSGIELINAWDEGNKTYATVYIPDGKLHIFFNMIEKYRTEIDSRSGGPKNENLLRNIGAIKLATLKAFWTDVENFEAIPVDQIHWWEVWLRVGDNSNEKAIIYDNFIQVSNTLGIEIRGQKLEFPERTVLLVKATKDQLTNSVMLLNCLAELRLPRDTADTFMRMSLTEQQSWVDELNSRVTPAPMDAPTVCLLDHGTNNGHPLLSHSLSTSDMHSYIPAWGTNDTHPQGHGTGMAGLSLYGDLFDVLMSTDPVRLGHRLESVKMIEQSQSNPPNLYGDVTKECVSRAEITAPHRPRTICMTVTSKESRFRGLPSSWSSAVDQLAVGADEEDAPKRLLTISAGNVEFSNFPNYPSINATESIHDPGQSWNAITVGSCTDKDTIDMRSMPGWQPLAPRGGLCPSSTTSLVWSQDWPIKPDVVMEGGNLAKELSTGNIDYVDSLQLLTTHKNPSARLFSTTGDTSASVALAARIMAIVQSNYREFWPETLRGLLVHSAEWTATMLSTLQLSSAGRLEKINFLRQYGYGVPSLDRALWSSQSALTLIAQDSLIPFRQDGTNIKTNELNLYHLPWPTEVLQDLGSAQVELRITLSYFIEPNPTHRKYLRKFDYQSHGLRFDIKAAAESIPEFRKRINRIAREEDENYEGSTSSIDWMLGPDVRNRGSVHSDIWRGTAADLAAMNSIGVFPVMGWWKTRKKLERWNSAARYSLIVTIRTESQEADIYTPVYNAIMPTAQIST